jgi:hypothetical protein
MPARAGLSVSTSAPASELDLRNRSFIDWVDGAVHRKVLWSSPALAPRVSTALDHMLDRAHSPSQARVVCSLSEGDDVVRAGAVLNLLDIGARLVAEPGSSRIPGGLNKLRDHSELLSGLSCCAFQLLIDIQPDVLRLLDASLNVAGYPVSVAAGRELRFDAAIDFGCSAGHLAGALADLDRSSRVLACEFGSAVARCDIAHLVRHRTKPEDSEGDAEAARSLARSLLAITGNPNLAAFAVEIGALRGLAVCERP